MSADPIPSSPSSSNPQQSSVLEFEPQAGPNANHNLSSSTAPLREAPQWVPSPVSQQQEAMADTPNTTTTAITPENKHEADPAVDNNAGKSDAKPAVPVSESNPKKTACKKHPGKEQDPNARTRSSKKKPRAGKSSSIVTPSDDSSSDLSSSSESTSSSDSAPEDEDSSSESSEPEVDRHTRRRLTRAKAKKRQRRNKKKKLKSRYESESDTESDVAETEQDDSLDEKQLKKFINKIKLKKKSRILDPKSDSSEDQQYDDDDTELLDISLTLAKAKLKSKQAQTEGKRGKGRARRSLGDQLGEGKKLKKKAGSKVAFKRVDQCA
jgi:hypothetical protein